MVVADVLTRLRWRARPLLTWGLAGVLGVLTAVVVQGSLAGAADQRATWGTGRAVVVATWSMVPGERVAAGDVRLQDWPAGLVPAGALVDPSDAVGGTVVAPVLAGEPLVHDRLAPEGLSAVAAQVPEGRRGVLVPPGPGLPPLAAGDRVDLLAAPDVLDPAGRPAVEVALDAPVVAVDDRGATAALVLRDELADVASALSRQAVVVALAGR